MFFINLFRDLRVQQIRGKSLQKVEKDLMKEKRGKSVAAVVERENEHAFDEKSEKEEK